MFDTLLVTGPVRNFDTPRPGPAGDAGQNGVTTRAGHPVRVEPVTRPPQPVAGGLRLHP